MYIYILHYCVYYVIMYVHTHTHIYIYTRIYIYIDQNMVAGFLSDKYLEDQASACGWWVMFQAPASEWSRRLCMSFAEGIPTSSHFDMFWWHFPIWTVMNHPLWGIPWYPTDHGCSPGAFVAPLCPCLPRMPWRCVPQDGTTHRVCAFCEGVSVLVRNQFRPELSTVG